jgi:hypothetical protein
MVINKHIDLRYIGDKSKIIDITNKRYYDVIPNIDSFILARNVHSTPEIVLSYPEWYILENIYFYFKKNDAFNELLMAELFKEFNLKCLEYQIAKDNNKIGILSKNFRKRGTSYFEYYSYPDDNGFYAYKTLNEFENYASQFINSDNLSALIAELSRLLVADFFSGQSDRNSCNLLLEQRKELKLAPISDNGAIFSTDEMNISRSCIDVLRFPKEAIVNTWEYNTLNLIVNNTEFRKYLIKCLDIDINEVIDRTINKYYLRLLKSERKEILSYFDAKKKIIDNTLKLVKKEN